MNAYDITEKEKNSFNAVVNHPLQAYEWGIFRKKTGIKILRKGFLDEKKLQSAFQLTIHRIPHTPWNIGYLPKGNMPTKEIIEELIKIGKQNNCIFIQLEPNHEVEKGKMKDERYFSFFISHLSSIKPAAHPLFTRYTFTLDLTKSEEELLKNMHSKTRYNIKVAQKHGVEIVEDNSDKAFEEYIRLTQETTQRQGFYAHTEEYHRIMWETLRIRNQELGIREKQKKEKNHNSSFIIPNSNKLTAHLFLAKYKPLSSDSHVTLVAWILFVYKDTLYYPYGASSSEYREAMASNLMMWEAIKFGKKIGLKKFDMWGAIGPNPDTKDPWYGFHRFKEGYGATLTEFIGSFDLVINPFLYQGYKIVDKLRWTMLRLKK